MEAKEYAKKLIYQYQDLVTNWDCYWDTLIPVEDRIEDMKKCALIDVQNTIDAFPKTHNTIYFEQVKQEIINFNPLT
jgi:hypothetical protein